jgi:hypothetical protein
MNSKNQHRKQILGGGVSPNDDIHEVFEDVNLGAIILFLFLLQLMQRVMNWGLCTC